MADKEIKLIREVKELAVRKLVPPAKVQRLMINKDKRRAHPNPIINFFKLFFGEGL